LHAQQVCVGRRTSALNSRVPADIDRYWAPAGAAAKLLLRRRRQISIKRQLLSTGQTDGRTDGHRNVTHTLHRTACGGGASINHYPVPPTQLLGTSSTIPDVQAGTRCCMMCNYCAQTCSSCPDSDGRPRPRPSLIQGVVPRRRPRQFTPRDEAMARRL